MEEQTAAVTALVEETSAEYLGHWNRLVSTTNWEKGRIIGQWRERLKEADAPPGAYSDEAWSRQVGSVSPQHVGRLRRVYQRFHEAVDRFPGLYWSHFQAALEWLDAEMYLEGAVQSGWSVAQMRQQRWEAMGGSAEEKPRDEDVLVAEFDEDVEVEAQPADEARAAAQGQAHAPEQGNGRSGTLAAPADDAVHSPDDAVPFDPEPVEVVRPFENVPPLPADLSDAVEQFKLAILHHKVAGWEEVSCESVLAALDALKTLAVTPA